MEAAIELYRLLNAMEPRPRNPELGREAVLALNPGLTNGEAAFIWQAFSYSTWGGGMTVETGRRFATFGLMYHGALSLSGSLFRGSSVRVAPRTAPRATPRAGGGVATYRPPGGGGVSAALSVQGRKITFGHGGRHLQGAGLTVSDVNRIIANDVARQQLQVGVSREISIVINGTKVTYRAILLPNGTINVGTYFISR